MENELLDNETLTVIHERRSVRLFLDSPIPMQHIETILRAANKAPSAHNLQSWRFIVIQGEKKDELAQLVHSCSDRFPRPACTLLRMASRTIAGAPVAIAIANTGKLIEHGTNLFKIDTAMANDFFRIMEIQSSAAAVENLLIAAKSLGIDSVWLGIMCLIKNEVLELLGERQGEFMAIVPIGYAAKPSEGPKKQSLGTVVKFLG